MASDGQTVKYARRAATGQGCDVVLPIICMALTKLVRLRLLDVEADICASLSDIQSHILARGMSGRVKPGWRRSEFSASKKSEEGEHHCRLEHALVLLVTPLVQAELVEELPQQINGDWEASALDCRVSRRPLDASHNTWRQQCVHRWISESGFEMHVAYCHVDMNCLWLNRLCDVCFEAAGHRVCSRHGRPSLQRTELRKFLFASGVRAPCCRGDCHGCQVGDLLHRSRRGRRIAVSGACCADGASCWNACQSDTEIGLGAAKPLVDIP